VDGFQHDLGVRASVSYEKNPGEASFGEGGSDVVLLGDVDVIQLRLLDVVNTQLLLFGLHSALAVVDNQRPGTGKLEILPE
jgi:hypothetical protein